MAQVRLEESFDFDGLMGRLAVNVRGKHAKKSVRAAGNVVVKDTRKRVPESRKTGTGDKQSQSVKNKRRKTLKQSIKVAVRDYGSTVLAVVGGSWPEGAHFHLVENDHEHVAWGRRTGAMIRGKKFFAAAVDTTQRQQHHAAVDTLRNGIIAEGG